MRKSLIKAASILTALALTTAIFCKSNTTPQQNELTLINQSLGTFSNSLALQAADWGYPLVVMYALRYNDALKPNAKTAPNQLWRLENITTPQLAAQAGYVTPNVNVIYGFGFLDLSQQPIILSVPNSNNRYYMVQLVDMYTNSFAYVGGVATGYKGGKFAIVGPDWQGALPDGVTRITAPTNWVLMQPRVHVVDQADLPAAQKVLNEITVQGLAQYLGQPAPTTKQYNYPAPNFTNDSLPVSALPFKDPMQFWQIMSATMNENPPPQNQIDALLPMFAPLNLVMGQTWNANQLLPPIATAMNNAASQIANLTNNLPIGHFINGWSMPPAAIGNPGNNYYLRAIIARVGLTANTPQEAIYFMAKVDGKGNTLSGQHQYTLTFKQTPPYIPPGFWSLTAYDLNNNYTIPNPINRYALGSDNKMQRNSDGSLTIYLQQKDPGKSKEANWLPVGCGPFYLILRSYAPGPAMVKSLTDPKAYTPPAVMEIK